jgi:hypothetical protein
MSNNIPAGCLLAVSVVSSVALGLAVVAGVAVPWPVLVAAAVVFVLALVLAGRPTDDDEGKP